MSILVVGCQETITLRKTEPETPVLAPLVKKADGRRLGEFHIPGYQIFVNFLSERGLNKASAWHGGSHRPV